MKENYENNSCATSTMGIKYSGFGELSRVSFHNKFCILGYRSNFAPTANRCGTLAAVQRNHIACKASIKENAMRKYTLFLIGFALLISCEKDTNLSNIELCDSEYFYYSGGSKLYLKHSLYEVWVEFEQKDVTKELAESILRTYSFIDFDFISGNNNYNRVRVMIKEKCDCTDFKNYLKELNKDKEIFSASPVLYLSENDPDSYWILLSEVLTKHNAELISETDFINYANTLNLELMESGYSTQHFKVKEVETGFEALDIANQIYESGKVQYSHPNFIAKIELY